MSKEKKKPTKYDEYVFGEGTGKSLCRNLYR